MKGLQHIKVTAGKVQYDITLRRKYTVIKGESGTGKTTLYSYVQEAQKKDSAIRLWSTAPCVTANELGKYWEAVLGMVHSSIVIIDEDSEWVKSDMFAEVAKASDNYYIIINRDPLPMLPYSVKEVYTIHTSGKFHTLRPYYANDSKVLKPDYVITEDSGSGYSFFSKLFKNCSSAGGNSNIYNILREKSLADGCGLVIGDGAAFGPFIDDVVGLKLYREQRIRLCLPESFEYMLLCSEMFKKDKDLQVVLEHPEDFVDTSYKSWEDFFTSLLKRVTQNTPAAYSKSADISCFTEPCCWCGTKCKWYCRNDKVASVVAQIKNVDLSNIRK